ncbi:MAG: phenylalanine--tRNA ligase subunit beta [Candidatus Caenarcaniphilales bacterium]|nr:phenylalanine--tRNA ligase subunit beta [Candidatus Caenarcaniphilales bacterium]
MKVPIEWIKDFVDVSEISPEKIADEISLKAFEVEKIELIGPNIKGPLVSGKIIEIFKHPNADKLQVTKVITENKKDPRQIVCGAKNIEVGQIVPVALPGAQVLDRKTGKKLSIKAGKIRDVESEGMLCSGDELGIESNIDGIYILSNEIPLGIDLIDRMKLVPEVVLDVESRSNRGDALSIQGIAREIAVCFKKDLKLDYYKLGLKNKFSERMKSLPRLSAKIVDSNSCSRIGFLKIKNVQVSQSPDWIKKRLTLANVSSINNIVDITNYVMLELGQPMHAYDSSKVNSKGALKVAFSKNVKGFQGLDEKVYDLNEKHLVISDEEKTLSIAGVMGGLESSVQETTKDIILEAASFSFSKVRSTSRSVGTISESSKRFERGSDPELIEIALYKAAELIKELSGGEVEACVIHESETYKKQNQEIVLSLQDYRNMIGEEISSERLIGILEKLGFEITQTSDYSFTVKVPSYRQKDVQRPIDLVEELARFQGLNNIQSKTLPGVSKLLPINSSKQKLKQLLVQQGYLESISSSLVPESSSKGVSLLNEQSNIRMKNPLSKDHSELRVSILQSLLSAVALNSRRQNNSIKLFEFGKIYGFDAISLGKPQEVEALAIVLSTKSKELNWKGNQLTSADFYELKGIVENLCLQKGRLLFKAIQKDSEFNNALSNSKLDKFLHPKISSIIQFNGKDIGYLGKLHPQICKELEIFDATYVVELVLESIDRELKVKTTELNDNPILLRDITIDLSNHANFNHSLFEQKIKQAKISSLKNIKVISQYKPIDQDATSLSYRLVFQSESELIGNEINNQIQSFKEKLLKEFSGITFRDG